MRNKMIDLMKGIGIFVVVLAHSEPPHVEYFLTEKGISVVPILQSICAWSGAYHKEENENTLLQCQKCDYHIIK